MALPVIYFIIQFLFMKNILLVFLFILGLFTNSIAQSASSADSSATFKVHGLCTICKDRIETAAKGKGVINVNWDVDTKQFTVVYNGKSANLDKIKNRIVAAGHDLDDHKANDAVYQALPSCCHYREKENETLHATNANVKLLQGVVLEEDAKGQFLPLTGASVVWMLAQKGTTTNTQGVFSIPESNNNEDRLVVSYTGYRNDTLSISANQALMVVLAKNGTLQEVKVTARQRSLYISTTNALRTQVMTEKELFKAACCNLSESFETNPSVDVSFNDAVTGSKQIQLLGLSGIYTQLTVENMPGPRGLATPMGLNYIPGTWVESIQLTKGTGSVANGFESIAGQINVEMKKPETAEKVYANLYVNSLGKTDVNLNLAQKVGKKWSTALLLHNDWLGNKMDYNKDGFRDLPTGNLFTAVNRWKYEGTNGLMSQFGVKLLTEDKTGGQMNFDPAKDKGTTNAYGLGFKTNRYEGFAKIGYVFPEKNTRVLVCNCRLFIISRMLTMARSLTIHCKTVFTAILFTNPSSATQLISSEPA